MTNEQIGKVIYHLIKTNSEHGWSFSLEKISENNIVIRGHKWRNNEIVTSEYYIPSTRYSDCENEKTIAFYIVQLFEILAIPTADRSLPENESRRHPLLKELVGYWNAGKSIENVAIQSMGVPAQLIKEPTNINPIIHNSKLTTEE